MHPFCSDRLQNCERPPKMPHLLPYASAPDQKGCIVTEYIVMKIAALLKHDMFGQITPILLHRMKNDR